MLVNDVRGSRLYGSRATSSAAGISRAFRAFLNSTAKRGPRPGLEVKVYNNWAVNHKEAK